MRFQNAINGKKIKSLKNAEQKFLLFINTTTFLGYYIHQVSYNSKFKFSPKIKRSLRLILHTGPNLYSWQTEEVDSHKAYAS